MSGRAYLVGAGPGSPDLITVRGMRLIREAEVVMYDRLVSPRLVEMAPGHAQRIFVGKAPGRHHVPQDEINRILVREVRAGRRVVRLKGGDPFVFGRGGEEALALAREGLPFEVVPGVSSAVAVPAYAGVPVTHRGVASAFAVVTGHLAEGVDAPVDWEALSRIPTLVVLMGMTRLGQVCAALIRAGRHPNTPAAAIHRGTTPDQRALWSTLAGLPEAVRGAGLGPPSVVVIGEVVRLGATLAWFAGDGMAGHGREAARCPGPGAASHHRSPVGAPHDVRRKRP